MSLDYSYNTGKALATTMRRRRREYEENKESMREQESEDAHSKTKTQHQGNKFTEEIKKERQKCKNQHHNNTVSRSGGNKNYKSYSDNTTNESIQAIEELQSLLRTRSMLNAELHKVDHVVHNLQQSNEQWSMLENTLHEVEASVQAARNFVHKLIRVQSLDDLILRLSILAFVCVIGYILAQRIFGFFPVVKYV